MSRRIIILSSTIVTTPSQTARREHAETESLVGLRIQKPDHFRKILELSFPNVLYQV